MLRIKFAYGCTSLHRLNIVLIHISRYITHKSKETLIKASGRGVVQPDLISEHHCLGLDIAKFGTSQGSCLIGQCLGLEGQVFWHKESN